MLTREQVNEYFAGEHDSESVTLALQELSRYDSSVDPESSEFSEEITEQLIDVLDVVKSAVNNHHQLTPQQVTAIAAEEGSKLGLPREIFERLVTAAIESAAMEAIALDQIQRDVASRTSAHLATKRLEEQQELSNKQMAFVTQVMGDKEKLAKILGEYGVEDAVVPEVQYSEDFNVDSYLEECRLGESPALKSGDRKTLITSLVKAATNG